MIIPEASGRCSSAATSIGACERAWSQQKSSVKEAPKDVHPASALAVGGSQPHGERERWASLASCAVASRSTETLAGYQIPFNAGSNDDSRFHM
jgi:hypothetical protein